MITKSFILIFILSPFSQLPAQSSDRTGSFEALTSVSYSYSTLTFQPYRDPYPVNWKNHYLSIQPTLAYYISDDFQLQLDAIYGLSLQYTTITPGSDSVAVTDLSQVHELGAAFGVTYNLQASSLLTLFLTPKIGLGWSRQIYDGPNGHFDAGWARPELSFPFVVFGGKFWLTDKSMILLFVQFKKVNPYHALFYADQYASFLSLGFGYGVRF